ncbi:MAG: hypothetical protein KDE27_19310, partial [Planctomycetes bacterium]|nr:hypothetical protein [Planctomycetota bacterium]
IPALAFAFLAREAERAGRRLRLDDAALDRLVRYGWPGNVRELENAIVRLGVLVDGEVVTADHVEEHVFGGRRHAVAGELPTLELRELEALAIRSAMQRYGGSKPKAAAALGIALKTLYNKLHAMGEPADPGADRPGD